MNDLLSTLIPVIMAAGIPFLEKTLFVLHRCYTIPFHLKLKDFSDIVFCVLFFQSFFYFNSYKVVYFII